MVSVFNENPTREKIILLLKKSTPMSIDDLSKQLNITPMGIRQHLLSLERKGIVDFVVKREGVGRPAFLYKLTEKADELFPKAYQKFIVSAFKDLEKNEGRKKIDDVFRWRKERLLKERKEALSDQKTLHDKIHRLKNILETEGYLVDLDDSDGNYKLKQFNCPIAKVASEFKEACRYELQMYRDLLKKEVTRSQCISEGDLSCTYVIPKAH
ncbi:MAG: transcriptional regulator [Nitrospirota bacterium]|nr:transcriptional regulator [Nitrospirota bacterium]MDH5768325.1 transcriptional regulator [Nitrospirota bacterium]